ncbi:MAG TPA: tetratricopeptide repeat protein [Longimicrobiales bacterium]|nr:tetratricopeptide repeat protein [Longimicrobiales bacterium]
MKRQGVPAADELLARAHALADEGDWEGMAELLREHIQDFEDDPAVQCWLGVAERELGLEGLAYERFKRALALEPTDPYVLATAGNAIAAFDDPDAERALRAAALTAPEVPLARLMYGAYLAREGFLEDALRELGAARELDPDDAQIAYELGVAHALAGALEAAVDALAEASRLDPDDGWARVVLGLALLESGREDEALVELLAGARLRDDDVDAQLVAALTSAALGHADAAYEMLERARLGAGAGDVATVEDVEERIDSGDEAAADYLREDFAPDLFRSRLRVRP